MFPLPNPLAYFRCIPSFHMTKRVTSPLCLPGVALCRGEITLLSLLYHIRSDFTMSLYILKNFCKSNLIISRHFPGEEAPPLYTPTTHTPSPSLAHLLSSIAYNPAFYRPTGIFIASKGVYERYLRLWGAL